jgi:hypothetical protein
MIIQIELESQPGDFSLGKFTLAANLTEPCGSTDSKGRAQFVNGFVLQDHLRFKGFRVHFFTSILCVVVVSFPQHQL